MRVPGLDKEFYVIGENVHTTRVLLRKGKLVMDDPNGVESVRFFVEKKRRYLPISDEAKKTQDYEEGRVKHVKIAVQAAMAGDETGMAYLRRLVDRQIQAGTDFLDLNVDEISLKPQEQQQAMQWLVEMVQQMTDVPVSVDSSNSETIEIGLAACKGDRRPLLNSASLERIDALDLAIRYNAQVVITAAGEKGMPEGPEQRIDHASRMVDAALKKGLAAADLFIDPLIFPISVDGEFGNHCFDAIRALRARYGDDIHITGGFSNVSFGIPCRHLVNDVFLNLAVEAGADSGIIDPVTSHLDRVFTMDRSTVPYQLAEAMLLGQDRFCRTFLRAFRKGELELN
ncbi:MAG: hypothetical protein GKR89_01675 [Candidatus Latescibacteria bacterium]|nr:hypothetical protein [Candidatus Latescibacterota bacterium]